MKENVKQITLDGVTKSIYQWSKDTGMSATTIARRLAYGWEPRDAVMTPPDTRQTGALSKNSVELMLNDMELLQLPEVFQRLIPPGCKSKKLGEYLRINHGKEFDAWYRNVYIKNHPKNDDRKNS